MTDRIKLTALVLIGYVMVFAFIATNKANGAECSPYDALDVLNRQRVSAGLRPYVRDEGLTRAAIAASHYRARHRIGGHTANDFAFLPRGCQANAAGCAGNEPSWGFMSCCRFENWTYAGAAWCLGRDGKAYCHLFVR